ncbi:RICIN domain-containing protein [Saccharopolyspora indica]|uniref:RICIN domain-containing protein n=1 Tax=Saccharopolyspora indica TaxID=1229659 RepID=UPI0022EA9707|nr:RICIN domain-containing protein [Saccharopolyspora indica]MDA3647688.1 RICIN domain-containing protein [Saccharopolyspora indica]
MSTNQPLHELGQRAQWDIERQEDGTVTIRNMASNQCAQTWSEPNAVVFTAECNKWDEAQRWSLTHQWDGFVITPAATPHLAVVASSDEYRSSQLVLGVRPFGGEDTPNAVFRFNS